MTTFSRWLKMAAAVGGAMVVALAVTAAAPAGGPVPESALPGELIYVASAGSGPVTAYAAGSHGSVTPVRTVDNPNKAGTVWDPWGVTFDAAGHLFVQSFLSNATTFVFAPGAHGHATPSRIFQVQGPDNSSIAVDGKGFEYVLGTESGSTIAVAAPGASGKPAGSYAVPAVRTIDLGGSFSPWPSLLSVDAKNELLVSVPAAQGFAIEVFAGGAHGGSKPVRVISGPHTGLGNCTTVCQVSVTFSPFTGRIYAAVSAGATTHISVFAQNASGDAHPVRTIEGPATGLAGMVITGIADSQKTGTIYAMVKTSQFGTGRIFAFARLANGNAAPLRTFTDRATGFAGAAGIAITR